MIQLLSGTELNANVEHRTDSPQVFQKAISADTTLTAVPDSLPGQQYILLIVTVGTTSRTVTLGTGFKVTGTLATGTTAAKIFAITFVSDGTQLIETGRTAAM